MRDLDDTDRTILDLLLDDARRSWRDIADAVDLSPPAVADRVERLEDVGVIRGFTLDVDRSKLREGAPVLVTLNVTPRAASAVADALGEADPVEHVFTTAEERVVFTATVPEGDVLSLLESTVVMDDVRDYEVSLLSDRSWNPSVAEAELALTCDECGNTVTPEGESRELDGETYHFCCESCEGSFVEMYEELRAGAEG
ncbi:AsnC family transcriptional regulator [Halosimplex litoreum]|uniref:AsnC family transcriptional regulator n=1 Tax=Halosimplex litoreum TaxID=1198301 RepID=A0A7T3FXZ6_9EURY|nr:AsnC family transcriptional regulator [Halosimplex litoreum]QPV62755.1 AsnC family transcriptional regulator [Halosimplex litoreum]